ncbi:phosphotransferase [Modestobacter sp. VKM Ac-2979]|uniref:phosphotransferase n=1 Tax=unclassified Modestobacter TaxID=2643866 RepID=UPI0022AB7768|nr:MULTISPECIES: phosphotransferase [unclassified Modestobacter]MCZ2811648.1 phosphotransferase [Modestobacter sp. VKM Ac-2979]MCZ2843371.1 phosphotransferase [Modestobacter sp. VKM Ac-2980]
MDHATPPPASTDEVEAQQPGTTATASAEEAQAEQEIRSVLAQLPGFEGEDTRWRWLSGGGAHKNFLVTAGDRQVVVKLWNCMWEGVAVVPPAPVVFHNTREAGAIGIGAPVVAVVQEPLALVIDFLPGQVMDRGGDGWIPRLAAKTRQLHDSGIQFANDYNPFAENRKMFSVARHRGAAFPDDIAELQREVARVEQVLDLRVNEFVPCHNDLYGANILECAEGIRLIDYDLSGMGDRCYDLGFASAYCEMDVDQVNRLCESYVGGVDEQTVARTRLFAVAADWASLGLWMVALSMADTNDDYDYAGELASSCRRLRRALDADDFGRQLERVRR